MSEKYTDIYIRVSRGPGNNTPTSSGITYPPAYYFSYGGGENIERNAAGEIVKVSYYNESGRYLGYSEFKRATNYFSFTRTDYWYSNGSLDYYVVNELDTRGDEIVSYFYYSNGTLFDIVRH